MEFLVGGTGFVGSNILAKHDFDGVFNSKNIEDAYGKNPDLLVYSGVRAEMFLANTAPDKDMEIIKGAIENIKKINPKKLILISTIAVYKNPVNIDEDYKINEEELLAYGYNRLQLEKWVEENMEDYLIVRLPAIYGINLKKNFIYDYIHVIPKMLNQAKFSELLEGNSKLSDYYGLLDNGLYGCKELTDNERTYLKDYFSNCGFSALNFTDSRAVYQFYNLKNLWEHIGIALDNGVKKLNIATEPVSVAQVYEYLKGEKFVNELPKEPLYYDYRTKHASLFNGSNGYIFDKETVLNDIKEYVEAQC